MFNSLRRDFLIFATLVIGAVVYSAYSIPLETFGAIDLLQYWTGAALLHTDQNPYDVTAVTALERMVFNGDHVPVLLWNPPLVFPVIWFFSTIDFVDLQKLWLVFGALLILAACEICIAAWSEVRNARITLVSRLTIFLFLLSFYPFYLSISYGQITPVLLIGFALFVAQSERIQSSKISAFIAGVGLSLTLLKPHLLYLVYLYLIFRTVRGKEAFRLIGLVAGGFGLLSFSLLYQPAILDWYFAAMQTPPIDWRTPTLGSWIQGFTGFHDPFVRCLPTILVGLCASVILWFKAGKENSTRWELLLGPISLATSPYGWVYDQMLLIPLLLWLIIDSSSRAHAETGYFRYLPQFLILLNIAMAVTPPDWGQDWYLWYPIAIGLTAAVWYRRFKREAVHI